MTYLEKIMEKVKSWTDAACAIIPSNYLKLTKDSEADSEASGKTLNQLWYDLCRFVNTANSNPKTDFLALPAIDAYLERLPWLYPVTLHQLEENEDEIKSVMNDITSLREEIQSQDAYHEWDEIQKRIIEFADQNHLTKPEINSLSEITAILLNALQVPVKWDRQQWRSGSDSYEPPTIYWNMPRFRYVSEFVDSLSLGSSCCIALGMIEPLVEDYDDPMLKAFGLAPELLRNARHHRGEQGLKRVHGGFAVIGIKRGENIWVLKERLGWDDNPYGRLDFDYYGHRSSFMPYQVTFKNADMKPGLMVRTQPAWDLRSILDKEQVIWLPIMAKAVQQVFFDSLIQNPMTLTVDSRSVKILGSVQDEVTTLATVTQNILRPSIFGVDNWGKGDELLTHLGITDQEMSNIPISLPMVENMTIDEYQKKIQNRVREAAALEASRRLQELFMATEHPLKSNCGWLDEVRAGKLELTKMFQDKVSKNMDHIIEMLNDADSPIHQMISVRVNGYVSGIERYSGRDIVSKTSIDDGRKRPYEVYYPHVWRFFPETIEGKRPPVAINIVPTTSQNVALLMGVDFNQLDWRIQFWNSNSFKNDDPVLKIENQYAKLKFRINLAFGKREFESMLPLIAAKYKKK